MLSCGENDLMFPSPDPLAEYAFLTDSVLEIMTDSGPAAASRPFLEAILSKDAAEGGNLSEGHGEGRSRIFASPAILWNPMP